jgi:hypothetical protein
MFEEYVEKTDLARRSRGDFPNKVRKWAIHMSYSFEEPPLPPICECKYDEARDEMDRDDCPFHCDLVAGFELVADSAKRPCSVSLEDDADAAA